MLSPKLDFKDQVLFNSKLFARCQVRRGNKQEVSYQRVKTNQEKRYHDSLYKFCRICGRFGRFDQHTKWHFNKHHQDYPPKQVRALHYGEHVLEYADSTIQYFVSNVDTLEQLRLQNMEVTNQLKLRDDDDREQELHKEANRLIKEADDRLTRTKDKKKETQQRNNPIQFSIPTQRGFDQIREKAVLANFKRRSNDPSQVRDQTASDITERVLNSNGDRSQDLSDLNDAFKEEQGIQDVSFNYDDQISSSAKTKSTERDLSLQQVKSFGLSDNAISQNNQDNVWQRFAQWSKWQLKMNRMRNMLMILVEQRQEIKKTFDDEWKKQEKSHLDRVFQERERHLKLYNCEAELMNRNKEVKESQECIALQRNEINTLITRLSKYARREFKDYPLAVGNNEVHDPLIWRLTREAETDEKLIEQMRDQIKSVLQENIKLKSQSINLQMMTNRDSHHLLTDENETRNYQPHGEENQMFDSQLDQISLKQPFQKQDEMINPLDYDDLNDTASFISTSEPQKAMNPLAPILNHQKRQQTNLNKRIKFNFNDEIYEGDQSVDQDSLEYTLEKIKQYEDQDDEQDIQHQRSETLLSLSHKKKGNETQKKQPKKQKQKMINCKTFETPQKEPRSYKKQKIRQ